MYPSSAQAYQSLQDFSKNRRSSQSITDEAQNKYDIPGFTTRLSKLRGLVGNLQSSVEAVDPSVTGRTTGNFTTEGQRQALVSKERAPILSDLGKQESALGQEQQGYSLAATLADSLARSMQSDDQTKYQSILDQYNAANAQEQQAESKRQYEATLAENKRQFDEQQKAAAKSAAQAAGGYSLGGGSAASAAPKANMAQRSNGGFNFTDSKGQSISAAKYASLTGTPISDLLYAMGKAGDSYSQQVYNQLKADPWRDKNLDKYKKLYSSLFWGT